MAADPEAAPVYRIAERSVALPVVVRDASSGSATFLVRSEAAENPPEGPNVHHAFVVDSDAYEESKQFLKSKGVEILLYEDTGHRSFSGRHAYFHDPDGNSIEIIDLEGGGETDAAAYEGRKRRLPKSHLGSA